MINNKVTRGVGIITNDSKYKSMRRLKNTMENPEMFPTKFELEVTYGLGYDKLKHYEDTQEGLTRHLANMEIRIWENCHKAEVMASRDMFLQAIGLEDAYKKETEFILEEVLKTEKAVRTRENNYKNIIKNLEDKNTMTREAARKKEIDYQNTIEYLKNKNKVTEQVEEHSEQPVKPIELLDLEHQEHETIREYAEKHGERYRVIVHDDNTLHIRKYYSTPIYSALALAFGKGERIMKAFPHVKSDHLNLENLDIKINNGIMLSHPEYGVHCITSGTV